MAHHIIYVPGIGDHRSYGQDIAIKFWRVFGLHAHYLALGWRNIEGFETKVKRLTDTIDQLINQGHCVSLCGTSAGASAVLEAYALRPNVYGVITIAGKIHNPQTVQQKIRDENPDFFEGAQRIKHNLSIISRRQDLKNILCVYAQADTTVPPGDAIIRDASSRRTLGWDHSSGIFFGITVESPAIARFVKSR